MTEILTIVTTVDDRAVAERIARAAIEKRLGACARVYSAASLYRWNGAVEAADEFVVEIKTTAGRRPALEALIGELHPYDLPEIVAHPIVGGSAAYLGWVSEACAAGSD